MVIENTEEEIIINFEIPPHCSKLTLKVIKLWLCDSMIIYYKERYLTRNLILPSGLTLPNKVIIKALSVFDKASDTEFILKKLGDFKNFNTRSFYMFKMGEVRARWQEVCDLFKRSLPTLLQADAFLDLIKYLLLVTDCSVKEVNLILESERLLILDDKHTKLCEPISVSDEDGYLAVIMELIYLCPAQIKINFSEFSKPNLTNYINNLFASKVIYCT